MMAASKARCFARSATIVCASSACPAAVAMSSALAPLPVASMSQPASSSAPIRMAVLRGDEQRRAAVRVDRVEIGRRALGATATTRPRQARGPHDGVPWKPRRTAPAMAPAVASERGLASNCRPCVRGRVATPDEPRWLSASLPGQPTGRRVPVVGGGGRVALASAGGARVVPALLFHYIPYRRCYAPLHVKAVAGSRRHRRSPPPAPCQRGVDVHAVALADLAQAAPDEHTSRALYTAQSEPSASAQNRSAGRELNLGKPRREAWRCWR